MSFVKNDIVKLLNSGLVNLGIRILDLGFSFDSGLRTLDLGLDIVLLIFPLCRAVV